VTYEASAKEIIRLFSQWENDAARSPNAKVALGAPLDPPSTEEATTLLARLRGLREEMAENEVDWHGRPVGDRDQAAMGQLWEEWRDEKLDLWNGYKEIWAGPDELSSYLSRF
jgi:hypothetical protein